MESPDAVPGPGMARLREKPALSHIYSLSCISMDTVTIVQSCFLTQSSQSCISDSDLGIWESLSSQRVQLKFQHELSCDSGWQEGLQSS